MNFSKVAQALGLSKKSTEKEVDQKLDELINANESDQNAEASADAEAEQADAEQQDQGHSANAEAAGQEAEASTEDAQLIVAELNAALEPITASLASINERLEKVESVDAAEETAGKSDPPDAKEPSYMNSPMNREVAEILAKRRKK